jgi:serine/threonine protein kinase
VEVDYRRRGGETPAREEYLAKFREHAAVIASVFAAGASPPRRASPGTKQDSDGGALACVDAETGIVRERVEGVDPAAPLFFGDYELRRKLGGTAMSTVWEAVQRSLKKRVAVKVLQAAPQASAAAAERFMQEARAVAQLTHPDIVDVHGIGRTDDGGYFLVMDLIEGMDLEKRIAEGSVPFREAAQIVATMAGAVQHAHDHGIIHRDLKPSNVLLEGGTRPLLTDFGLAKYLHGDIAKLTDTHEILGTPCYMAPEQADRWWGRIGPRTDVFGLGGVLYALLTRSPPFTGATVTEVLDKVKSKSTPALPSALEERVPRTLELICMRCLCKDPEERYVSARHVELALRDWLAHPEAYGLGDLEPEAVLRRIADATDTEAVDFIQELERSGRSAAIRSLLRCLTHRSAGVRRAAGKAILRIGWDRMTLEIERLAREGQEEDLTAALEGLSAFEAHPDTVSLLERLVPVLHGRLRHHAVLLLERKRLALTSDRITALFEELDSRYRIEKALGQGLFTACYLARDERFGAPVVVRVLRPELAAQPEVAARFLDLARESFAHVHQNLLAVRDLGSAPEHRLYYVVRDYVDGITLQRLLHSERKEFSWREVLEILEQVCGALGPIHAAGLAHGGIKPSNIFLARNRRVVLGDRTLPAFRCSVPLERLAYDLSYAAPETTTGAAEPGPASDLYALGCVAHQLLSGKPPFVSDRPAELLVLHAREPVPAVPARPDLGNLGLIVISRLLKKQPEDRFRSAEELAELLHFMQRPPSRYLMSKVSSPREEEIDLASSSVIAQLEASQLSTALSDVTPSSRGADLESSSRAGRSVEPLEVSELRLPGFRIIRPVGRGGMGAVYEAMQIKPERRVALKIIRVSVAPTLIDPLLQRFRREAKVAGQLSHPHIVPVYELKSENELMILVMPFIAGGALSNRIRRGPLSLCDALPIAEQVADALAYAHSTGIIHRDVKPGNILLDEQESAYLNDFGLAGLLKRSSDDLSLTHSGEILGTPLYMPPEQFGSGDPTPASDVYGLGVTLYEMLSHKKPYEGRSFAAVAALVARGKFLPLERVVRVPRQVANLVSVMMNVKPAKRPSAHDVVKELRSLRQKYCRKGGTAE